jgi:RNA polymerase sigma-70 factor (ECF subfamily)
VHIDEIGLFGLNFIKSKARELVVKYGFPWSEFESLQQEMLLDLIQRPPKFDPRRSPLNAFITRIVEHKAFDLSVRRAKPSQRHIRCQLSIDLVLQRDGRPLTLGDTLGDPRPAGDRADLAMDLARAIASLPKDLRSLWDLMVKGQTLTEISAQTGIPRPTLYGRLDKLREHLKRAGMGAYFEKS